MVQQTKPRVRMSHDGARTKNFCCFLDCKSEANKSSMQYAMSLQYHYDSIQYLVIFSKVTAVDLCVNSEYAYICIWIPQSNETYSIDKEM